MFDEKSHSLKMDKAIEVFSKELSSLRTGRANSAMLDLVKVDVYGQQMPINQIGSITTPEPRMINIQVWDQNNVPLVEVRNFAILPISATDLSIITSSGALKNSPLNAFAHSIAPDKCSPPSSGSPSYNPHLSPTFLTTYGCVELSVISILDFAPVTGSVVHIGAQGVTPLNTKS